MACRALLVLVLAYLYSPAKGHNTACNVGIPELCLRGNLTFEGVQGLSTNQQRFWFGTPFNTTCKDGNQSTVLCQNPAPAFQSILARMLMSNNTSNQTIGQVIGVHYPISGVNTTLKVCGSSLFVAGAASGYVVDATHSVSTSAWLLQVRPHVWWNASLATAGTKFTLALWDPGHFQLHGLWVNVPTGQLPTTAQALATTEVVPYRGPANYFMTTSSSSINPYTFALFEQNSIPTINLTEAYDFVEKSQRTYGIVSMADLISKFQLSGPIGLSTLQMKVDEYLAEMGLRRQVINNCPALRTTGLSSLLSYNFTGSTLSVSVDVVFNTTADTVSACCTSAPYMADSRMSDSKFEQDLPPFVTRSQPLVNLVQTYLQEEPFYFTRRRFTLLFVDVTDITAATLHWQVINIMDPRLQTGVQAISYFAPVPVENTRKMAFFLLEQARELTTAESFGPFTSPCNITALGQRCQFDLPTMMKTLTLSLRGVTGFKSSADLWSRQQAVSVLGLANATACAGVPGFAAPCPSPTTPPPTVTPGGGTCAGQTSLASPSASLASLAVVALGAFFSLSFFIALR